MLYGDTYPSISAYLCARHDRYRVTVLLSAVPYAVGGAVAVAGGVGAGAASASPPRLVLIGSAGASSSSDRWGGESQDRNHDTTERASPDARCRRYALGDVGRSCNGIGEPV